VVDFSRNAYVFADHLIADLTEDVPFGRISNELRDRWRERAAYRQPKARSHPPAEPLVDFYLVSQTQTVDRASSSLARSKAFDRASNGERLIWSHI